MTINWNMGARLYIKPVLSGKPQSDKHDFESDLRTCVEIARAWPPEVVYTLHTDEIIMGKNILARSDVEKLALPG
jgi:hypothetical protein